MGEKDEGSRDLIPAAVVKAIVILVGLMALVLTIAMFNFIRTTTPCQRQGTCTYHTPITRGEP